MRLTDTNIAKLAMPAGKRDHIETDDGIPLFCVRLRLNQKGRLHKSWAFQYRHGKRQRRKTIGVVGAMGANAARAIAIKLYSQSRLGLDPVGEIERAQTTQAETFLAAVKVYLGRQAQRLRPRSLVELRRHLLVHSKLLHRMALVEIKRRDISRVVSIIAESSGPTAANRTGSSIAAFLAWALNDGWIDHNVAATINKLHEEPRSCVLSSAELFSVWQATEAPTDYHAIVRLLALTGMRRAEVGDLHWSEVDLDRGVITLPEQRTKNARPFELPLSAAAATILEARPRDGERVFEGFSGFSSCKLALDARAKIAPWVLHDLRRSVATGMANLGVPPHVIEQVLNHQSGSKAGVAGVYNRSTYGNEKRQALQLWAEHLAAIVEDRPSKVVTLRA